MRPDTPTITRLRPDLKEQRRAFWACRHRRSYADGRPRPCRSQKCPCELCRVGYARQEAAVLRRSFRERPPHFFLTLRVIDGETVPDRQFAQFLRTFTQRIRDYRKCGSTLEYHLAVEFRHEIPHCHLLLIATPGWQPTEAKRLIREWWTVSCPERSTAVYCDRVKNPVGVANYVAKNLLDRRRVELPPVWWNGRQCRLVWRSRGFLTASKAKLWREQCAEWYPPIAELPEVPVDRERGTSTQPAIATGQTPQLRPKTLTWQPTRCSPDFASLSNCGNFGWQKGKSHRPLPREP